MISIKEEEEEKEGGSMEFCRFTIWRKLQSLSAESDGSKAKRTLPLQKKVRKADETTSLE